MADLRDDEREAWSDLLRSPGWTLFVEEVSRAWGDGPVANSLAALLDRGGEQTRDELLKLAAARRAAHEILLIPTRRLEQIGRVEADIERTPMLTRRA